ncbi:MAG: heavy-metal-associated domain-containing protein [Propionibacteriaceae bacterium]|nr:heavy-metal-associated domain-containing protein [Propionibacteriaceae bacterium]
MISNYTVTGMTCGRCSAHVTEEVSELDGVTGVNVNHETGAMVVESEDRLPFDAIIEAVSEAGDYTVVEV